MLNQTQSARTTSSPCRVVDGFIACLLKIDEGPNEVGLERLALQSWTESLGDAGNRKLLGHHPHIRMSECTSQTVAEGVPWCETIRHTALSEATKLEFPWNR